jgi:hypothetical protein
MCVNYRRGCNVICAGRIFKDGFGAIVYFPKIMDKAWIWKVKTHERK